MSDKRRLGEPLRYGVSWWHTMHILGGRLVRAYVVQDAYAPSELIDGGTVRRLVTPTSEIEAVFWETDDGPIVNGTFVTPRQRREKRQ